MEHQNDWSSLEVILDIGYRTQVNRAEKQVAYNPVLSQQRSDTKGTTGNLRQPDEDSTGPVTSMLTFPIDQAALLKRIGHSNVIQVEMRFKKKDEKKIRLEVAFISGDCVIVRCPLQTSATAEPTPSEIYSKWNLADLNGTESYVLFLSLSNDCETLVIIQTAVFDTLHNALWPLVENRSKLENEKNKYKPKDNILQHFS